MDEKKVIGGYFGLEFDTRSNEYYSNLIKLNSARNAILLAILERKYSKIYLPIYNCGVVISLLKKNGIEVVEYEINDYLEIRDIPVLGKNDGLIYTNYFGLKDNYVQYLSNNIENLIIDNAQAFFSTPLKNIDTVYSPRKFFGVPDGGYLCSNIQQSKIKLQQDTSIDRFSHLLKRIDLSPELGYEDFIINDKSLDNEPIKKLSLLTEKILSSNIDYINVKRIRNNNYLYLHKNLSKSNLLNINFNLEASPMIYPFMSDNQHLKSYLIKNKIFVATYWPDVLERCKKGSLEELFTNSVIALPIDQRYTINDMDRILSFII
ncbi:MAG: hypothetical protein H6587_06770 [Flavobacteriales bacterium]|nr:hypothetical protein [Flavobacteriales bacterium]MCB9499645.1 hypothetical protein [Erysipelotrichaceae bacterium]